MGKRHNITYYTWSWPDWVPSLRVNKLNAGLREIRAMSPVILHSLHIPARKLSQRVHVWLEFTRSPAVTPDEVEALLRGTELEQFMSEEDSIIHGSISIKNPSIMLEFSCSPDEGQRGAYVATLLAKLVRELGIRDTFMPHRNPDVCIRTFDEELIPYGRTLGKIIEEILA